MLKLLLVYTYACRSVYKRFALFFLSTSMNYIFDKYRNINSNIQNFCPLVTIYKALRLSRWFLAFKTNQAQAPGVIVFFLIIITPPLTLCLIIHKGVLFNRYRVFIFILRKLFNVRCLCITSIRYRVFILIMRKILNVRCRDNNTCVWPIFRKRFFPFKHAIMRCYRYIHSVTYEIADYALISIDFSTARQMKEEEEEVYTIIQFFPGVISNLELTNKSSMTHTYQAIPNVFHW